MRITVNGEPCELPDGATLADLVDQRGLTGAVCAVEVNKRVTPRAERERVRLCDGDTVEIVTLVGGG